MGINDWIDQHQEELAGISDQIWSFAELQFQETQSAELLTATLEKYGFKVEKPIAGMPTAFIASHSEGKPVIAILGEYDALPGLSQDKTTFKQPLEEGGTGHGCGHNLLGVGSLAACLALKAEMIEKGIPGTIRYYGCPAEEGGSAKTFMAKAGRFDDVDIALCWHPADFNGVFSASTLAMFSIFFQFHGITAHAALDPFNGRSALDAVELMNVGANYLREHVIPQARLHYIITKGGEAPNIVPAFAETLYFVRAPRLSQVREVLERLTDVANGAALMTGTKCEVKFHSASASILNNRTIERAMHSKLEKVGAPKFDEKELEFAGRIADTIPKEAKGGMIASLGKDAEEFLKSIQDEVLAEQIMPYSDEDVVLPGSTDVGDVSWVVPTAQIMTTCCTLFSPGHSWQIVSQSGMSIGHRGTLYAGKVLAETALELLTNPDLVRAAQEEFKVKVDKDPYVSPIPDGVKPALDFY